MLKYVLHYETEGVKDIDETIGCVMWHAISLVQAVMHYRMPINEI